MPLLPKAGCVHVYEFSNDVVVRHFNDSRDPLQAAHIDGITYDRIFGSHGTVFRHVDVVFGHPVKV